MAFLSVLLLAALLAELVTGDPTECYYCFKGLSDCGNPANLTTTSVCQMDSISESLTSMEMFQTQTIAVSRVSGGTCTKLSMSNGTHTETARFCSYKYVEDENVCDFLEQNLILDGLNFSCLTCDTNLCNGS